MTAELVRVPVPGAPDLMAVELDGLAAEGFAR